MNTGIESIALLQLTVLILKMAINMPMPYTARGANDGVCKNKYAPKDNEHMAITVKIETSRDNFLLLLEYITVFIKNIIPENNNSTFHKRPMSVYMKLK